MTNKMSEEQEDCDGCCQGISDTGLKQSGINSLSLVTISAEALGCKL